MMEAWKIAQTVPSTFDGTPPELLSTDGEGQETIKIGDTLLVPDEHGQEVPVTIEEIASMGDKAMAIVRDETASKRWTVQIPLTEGEAKAAARFTDAVFGKDNASRGISDKDPIGLYDFLLSANANLTQEQADKFFTDHPTVQHYKDLPLKEARVRIAREYTKWMWARKGQKPPNSK